MSSTRTKSVASCSTVDGVFDYDLPHILKERVVDTPGHKAVQEVRGVAGYLFVGVWGCGRMCVCRGLGMFVCGGRRGHGVCVFVCGCGREGCLCVEVCGGVVGRLLCGHLCVCVKGGDWGWLWMERTLTYAYARVA